MNNVLLILIAHPTKMKDGSAPPNLYDVSGSADFRNQTHDGVTIHRYFDENPHTVFINTKTKFEFQGEMGKQVEFLYDTDNGRYYARDSRPDKSDWTIQAQPSIPLEPNLDFDNIEQEDECPF